MNGTLTKEDIYGVGSLDTAEVSTKGKTNPSDSDVTGMVPKGKEGIWNMKGNFMGQPLTVWLAMIAILIVLKYVVEGKVA